MRLEPRRGLRDKERKRPPRVASWFGAGAGRVECGKWSLSLSLSLVAVAVAASAAGCWLLAAGCWTGGRRRRRMEMGKEPKKV